MKRTILLHLKDGTSKQFDIAKLAVIKGMGAGDKMLFCLDRLKDDTCRLVIGEGFVDDVTKIVALEFVEED